MHLLCKEAEVVSNDEGHHSVYVVSAVILDGHTE